MALFFNILTILCALIGLLISWIYWKQQYWKRKGLFTPEYDFFWGHVRAVLTQKESFSDFIRKLYATFKGNGDVHGGFYMVLSKGYLPVEPKLIKDILEDHFEHFSNRGLYCNENGDPLSAHMFKLAGQRWRKFKLKLTPILTTNHKMQMSFLDVLRRSGSQLETILDHKLGSIDITDLLLRFTSDIMGNCALGVEMNALSNADSEFCRKIRLIASAQSQNSRKELLTSLLPNLAGLFNISLLDSKISNYFMELITQTAIYREKNGVWKQDLMHFVLQLKNFGEFYDEKKRFKKAAEKEEAFLICFNEMAALAFGFFLAGIQKCCSTLSFCLFELASNPEIQEKLRGEINRISPKNEEISFETLSKMEYLEQVINETLRKYPPIPVLNRICTKTYKVPGTDLELMEGTKLFIPVIGLHYDEKYFPNPEQFNPGRFAPENRGNRPAFTYMPFGEGPRNCIGMRFAMMQAKVGLVILLKRYIFSVSCKTKVPLVMDPKSWVLSPKDGIFLDFAKV